MLVGSQIVKPELGSPRCFARRFAVEKQELSIDLEERIEQRYKELLSERYYLVHAAEIIQPPVAPGSGLFRARVWVAGEAGNKLNGVATVTYRVWDDFPDKQITTTDRADQFAVWLSVNGEFPILAYIQLENRKKVWQRRYLDLPGRPRDK
jgi:pYEATS domain-containing protein involved in immunity